MKKFVLLAFLLLNSSLFGQNVVLLMRSLAKENNAPAIFHPMHGCKEYQNVFHNTDEQYNDYKRFGMHVTVISILAKIDLVNLSLGLKPMPKWYLEGILKESELWCKYYGIRW